MNAAEPFAIVVTGLTFEAAIARSDKVRICCGHGNHLKRVLEAACDDACAGIISFGIAGGLDPALPAGTAIVASEIVSDAGVWATDEEWSTLIVRHGGAVVSGGLAGVDAPVVEPTHKARLFAETGAAGLDMESHIAARFAAERGARFAALRVIADMADDAVPRAATAGMRMDGTVDLKAVIGGILRQPSALPAIIRLAMTTGHARRTLMQVRRSLGPGFGLLDSV